MSGFFIPIFHLIIGEAKMAFHASVLSFQVA